MLPPLSSDRRRTSMVHIKYGHSYVFRRTFSRFLSWSLCFMGVSVLFALRTPSHIFPMCCLLELALIIGTGAGVVVDPGTATWRPLLVWATRYFHTTDWAQLLILSIAYRISQQTSGVGLSSTPNGIEGVQFAAQVQIAATLVESLKNGWSEHFSECCWWLFIGKVLSSLMF